MPHSTVSTYDECPLSVGVEGRDVVLFARTERLGVLLTPEAARNLAASLVEAARRVCG